MKEVQSSHEAMLGVVQSWRRSAHMDVHAHWFSIWEADGMPQSFLVGTDQTTGQWAQVRGFWLIRLATHWVLGAPSSCSWTEWHPPTLQSPDRKSVV